MKHTPPRATASRVNQKATVPTAHSRAEESGQTEQPALELGAAKSGRGPPGGAADTDVGHLPRTIQKTDMLHLPFASGGNLKPKRGRRGKLSEPWGLYKTAEAAHEGLWSCASLTRKQTKKPNQHPHKKKKERKSPSPGWRKHKQITSTMRDPGSCGKRHL